MEIRIRIRKPLVMAICAFLLSSGFRIYDELFEYSKNLEIFAAAYKEVGKNFVDEQDPGKLMRKGLDAMLASLDPYTVYYSETQAEEALMDKQGEYSGMGCRLMLRNHYPVVSEVFGGYAFSKGDIRPGDILQKIAGQDLKNKTIGEVSVFMRGAPNTEVAVIVIREGQILEKTVTRLQVRSKNVPYFGMADAETGYIKLETFGQNCASEISNALQSLHKDGKMKYAVLDLRDNGGGLLHEAVNIVGLFTGPGKLVVNMHGRTDDSKKDWITQGSTAFQNMPLVVLVNNHSASASEVVSGSLQDMDRALIVGRNSFGKGLVQNYFQLPYRTQMKITTAKYYTPSGRCIQMLDYSHRNADGSVGALPDSLRKVFKTAGGRTVLDGGGIKPDLMVDEFAGQPLLKFMIDEHQLFDYANHYRNTHDKIAPAASFHLSQEELNSFVENTAATLQKLIIDKIKKSLSVSTGDTLLSNKLMHGAGMEASVKSEITAKLNSFIKPIAYRLEQEILRRYYFDDALYESSFTGDPDLEAALKILHDSVQYQRILKP
jgi:carboxyl-terminal processing protease